MVYKYYTMINIVVTSKPVDGLLYYSYEYCDMLNKAGYSAQVVVITHRNSILDLVDRVLVMDEGAIVMDTTPQKLRQQK